MVNEDENAVPKRIEEVLFMIAYLLKKDQKWLNKERGQVTLKLILRWVKATKGHCWL
jgi:hypothetical protein